MSMQFSIFLFTIICKACVTTVHEKAVYEHRRDFVKNDKPLGYTESLTIMHDVIFAVRQMNMKSLENILLDVSDPVSPNYGKHLTGSEVASITGNPIGNIKVIQHLNFFNITILNQTIYGEFITARANIKQWSLFFSNEFYKFNHISNQYDHVYRALYYSLPGDLHEHVDTVFYVIHLPLPKPRIYPLLQLNQKLSNTITPSVLNSFYNIFTNTGSMSVSQNVYMAIEQYFSSADIATFQSRYGIPAHLIDSDPNNRDSATACNKNVNSCIEGDLDVQYMLAIAQNTYTTVT